MTYLTVEDEDFLVTEDEDYIVLEYSTVAGEGTAEEEEVPTYYSG